MADLAVEGVSKAFGAALVLRGVSAHLAEGEFLSLVGPSGCGKTTLLRIIAGLETADAGRVWIGGRDVSALRPAARDVAMVFQNYALYPHLTVLQNMAVPLVMRRLSGAERLPLLRHFIPGHRARRAGIVGAVREAAEVLQIGHLLGRRPAQLSGGQRQRVALGRALVRQPAAFLMDEPLSNLDAELRAQTRKEIVELHRRAGVTTVYVTHDQVEAMTMSDRVALMLDGRILQIGTPRALYDDPADLRVAQFLGSPRINVLNGIASGEGVRVGATVLPFAVDATEGASVRIGLRPERVTLAAAGLPGLVTHVEYLGAEALVHADFGGGAVVARVPGGVAVVAGEAVALAVDWAAALVFDAAGARVGVRRVLAHV